MPAGVYVIRNSQDDRVYVGSTDDLDGRWRDHQRDLRTGKHSSHHLMDAWNDLGEEVFRFDKILVVENRDHLQIYEQFWMDRLNAHYLKGGFNILPKASPARSYKHTRKRIKKPDVEQSKAELEAFIARGPFQVKGRTILDRRTSAIFVANTEWIAVQILVALHFNNRWEGYPIGHPDGEDLMRSLQRGRDA